MLLILMLGRLWGAEIKENPPTVHYDEVMANDKGVGAWTNLIVRLLFVALEFELTKRRGNMGFAL